MEIAVPLWEVSHMVCYFMHSTMGGRVNKASSQMQATLQSGMQVRHMLNFLKHIMRFGHHEFERMTAGIEVWERQGFHDRLEYHTTCLTMRDLIHGSCASGVRLRGIVCSPRCRLLLVACITIPTIGGNEQPHAYHQHINRTHMHHSALCKAAWQDQSVYATVG